MAELSLEPAGPQVPWAGGQRGQSEGCGGRGAELAQPLSPALLCPASPRDPWLEARAATWTGVRAPP